MESFSNNDINLFLTFVVSFLISMLVTKKLIPILIRKKAGQNIREEGPISHLTKAGTPSMGGIAIGVAVIIASIAGSFAIGDLKNAIICTLGFVSFGIIGLVDDYLNIIRGKNEGLTPKQKFAMQFALATLFSIYFAFFSGLGTDLYIPFFDKYVDIGFFFVPFAIFTILAMTNGTNLTDGIDGLLSSVTALVSICIFAFAKGLGFIGTEVFLIALIGSCLGFLVYNKNPAKIFMGDTGSLAIGSGLSIACFSMKLELLLPLVGIIYVAETVSVIMQVAYFKKTGGKRLFRMTPIHHHVELGGVSEKGVVLRFCVVTIIVGVLVLALG